jgi:hypothetical protein
MGTVLYVIIIVLLVSTSIKNFTLFKRYKHNKEYIECYKDLLRNNENTLERINNYIENENSNEFKNKGRILKLYQELISDLDYSTTLNELNVKDIFYDKNGNLKKDLINFNSDSFLFIMLVLSKAHQMNKDELIEPLTNKVLEVKGLEDHLEVKEIVALNNALLSKDDKGVALFNSFLDGSYTEYVYDKNMIGLFKRIAVSTLAYLNEPFDEFFIDDIKDFAKTLIGKEYTSNLGIYDKYHVEEVAEEEKVEEVKEENNEDK